MKRCGKPLASIKYNDFRRQFLIEPNKKLSERKEYFKEDYVKIWGSFTI